ncbi:hypothetical protein PHYC_01218 [Phycisphaerales bacterium]|nr:hypothetical protein PHYC_01218 [Phycisphaerales bacterium]
MRADFQTYRSAAGAAIKGLIFQLLIALITAVYSFWGRDYAALSGAIFMLAGVPAWLALAIVYDQHRRERVEAMENEALAASASAGTSVFESREDFRPAAARLASLYRWFFPIVSLVSAAILIGGGLWRFSLARVVSGEQFIAPSQPGWSLGLGVTFAAMGFVVARYVAGLAKQPVWANLRAGAAFAVGSSLIWFLMAVSHLVDYVGPDTIVRIVPMVVAVFMIAIGCEILLHFILTLYRPRRAGELPRPAFESRLLGFAAAPDRIAQSISDAINYQLGFDVTSGWGYRLLSRSMVPLILVGGVVVWVMSGVVVVEPHQRAMILRFGRPVRTDLGPGWHFKWMWPIETAYVPEYYTKDEKGRLTLQDYTATGLRRVELATMPPATTEPILWTNDHIGEEVWQYVRISDSAAGAGLTDIAAISVEIPMQYSVSDVEAYDRLGPPGQRDEIIRTAARREVTRFFQNYTLDQILGGDRAALSRKLQAKVQEALTDLNPDESGKGRGAGVEIVFLGITGVHPPKETANAFETPVQATQRREAKLAAAEADAVQQLTSVVGSVESARTIVREIESLERMRDNHKVGDIQANVTEIEQQRTKVQEMLRNAGGWAAATLADAGAERWHKHMGARAEAARYSGQVALFEASPAIFRATRFFEAFNEGMKDTRLYVVSDRVRDLNGVLDLKDVNLGVDIFNKDENK